MASFLEIAEQNVSAAFAQAAACVLGSMNLPDPQPDEYIELSALEDTVRMLRSLIHRCCMAS